MTYTAIVGGYTPNQMSFYEEGKLAAPDDMGDSIARIVMERFRRAHESKRNHRIYQGSTSIQLFREAENAMEKVYNPGDAENIQHAFGFTPSRYYGLSSAKVRGIADWKLDLVAGSVENLVRVTPSPDPRLDEVSKARIKEAVKAELLERMLSSGTGDPKMLLDVVSGRLRPEVKKFLDNRAIAIRQVEQAHMVNAAAGAAAAVQTKMRDMAIEGGFRDAYAAFNYNTFAYGVGILKFPHYQRRVVLSDKQDRKGRAERMWKVVPTFSSVSPWNFFVTNDGRTADDCTAVMEYREYNKAELVRLAKDPKYDGDAILEILDKYSFKGRAWLMPEATDTKAENGSSAGYWGPEESVAVLSMQGWLTGSDLQKYGQTGYDSSDILHVHAEVVLGRTIRLEVKDPLQSTPRSYAVSKFDSLGDGVFNAVGIPAILRDTQNRVNTMLHLYEANMDEAARPPKMINPEVFRNPHEAHKIVAGGQYQVSDLFGGAGSMPEPIRALRSPSIFQIIWPLILQAARLADEEVGVPQMALTGDQYGKGSLGEYSARISNALRRIKAAAYAEDRALEPMWRTVFETVLDENPVLVENVDLDMSFQGITGILTQDLEKKAKVDRLSLVDHAVQSGVAPPEVAQYAYQDALKATGIPTEALGMDDPLISQAMAIAASNPVPTSPGNQVPELDGRSAPALQPGVTATPQGASTALPPPV
jgi:hypothetical protein